MKDVFSKLLSETRSIDDGRSWLNKTFENEVYQSSWFYSLLPLKREEIKYVESRQGMSVSNTNGKESTSCSLTSSDTLKEKKEQDQKESTPKKGRFSEILNEGKVKKTLNENTALKSTSGRSFENYLESLNPNLNEEMVSGLSEFTNSIDILFYGERNISDPKELDFSVHSLFNHDRDLLGKMIKSMNIPNGKFLRSSILGEGKSAKENFIFEVSYFRPKVVVALGASALNLILERKERLSRVHGSFFPGSIDIDGETHSFSIVPLFHPDFLEINPSMKRTAWIDMQKIMDHLS